MVLGEVYPALGEGHVDEDPEELAVHGPAVRLVGEHPVAHRVPHEGLIKKSYEHLAVGLARLLYRHAHGPVPLLSPITSLARYCLLACSFARLLDGRMSHR